MVVMIDIKNEIIPFPMYSFSIKSDNYEDILISHKCNENIVSLLIKDKSK